MTARKTARKKAATKPAPKRAAKKPTGRPRGRPRKIREVPPDLRKLFETASSPEESIFALKQLALGAMLPEGAPGHVDRQVAKLLIDVAKEMRQQHKASPPKETGPSILTEAVDVLTPEERTLVDAHRAGRARAPLKPGETPPPPEA